MPLVARQLRGDYLPIKKQKVASVCVFLGDGPGRHKPILSSSHINFTHPSEEACEKRFRKENAYPPIRNIGEFLAERWAADEG